MAPVARNFGRRDTVLLGVCIVLSMIAQGLPDRLRDPIATALRRTLVAPLIALQRNAERSRRAWLTRDERVAAHDSLVLRSYMLASVQGENERLRRLLGLGQQLRWGFVPAEVLQGRGVGEEYSVTLSVGSRAGVRPFSPIIAPDGVVGLVRNVDPSMSVGIVWAHPDFRVSAMAADGSTFGIVAAHLGGEPDRYLLEMRGVPIRSSLKPGTLVVSSGLGGVFPRGIPVGVVLAELKTPEIWARTYLLRPAVPPAEMSSVMVLLPQRSAAGVKDVWPEERKADSTLPRGADTATVAALAGTASGRDRPAARDTSVTRDSTARKRP